MNEKGSAYRKEFNKEFLKQVAIGTATISTLMSAPKYINAGKQAITNRRTYVYLNNLAVNQLAKEAGLNTISKKGIGRAGACVRRGKKIAEAMIKRTT